MLAIKRVRLFNTWAADAPASCRVLDLGCGAGSLSPQLSRLHRFGVDTDLTALQKSDMAGCVCSSSERLPFAASSFDLVVCHHSLEHFKYVGETLSEIRRVLAPAGRLFITIPDGYSFSDGLYRLLLCGGGHHQRFRFDNIVRDVEAATSLHLIGLRALVSSFLFVDRLNFLPAPVGRLPGPLPRRMRWLGRLPASSFNLARWFLNVATKSADRVFGTRFSTYGWALAFAPEQRTLAVEPANSNVCMTCGLGLDEDPLERVAGLFYRCPQCSRLNWRSPAPMA